MASDIVFISHGGGPLPLLNDPGHREMVTQLKALSAQLPTPELILVISAHWEAQQPTVTSSDRPSLIYDYSGFPPESYNIQYPTPGHPKFADQLITALNHRGIAAQTDAHRGLDHGVFVPLTIMYPEADIPCVQLSLINGLDPAEHIALGNALRDIDQPGLLVIGSGFSFHNMRAFFAPDSAEIREANSAFQEWLEDTCTNSELTEEERQQRLINWASAPHARFCHPREEHLLPLHVCAGMAGRAADQHIATEILNKASGMYYWQGQQRNHIG